MKHFRSLAFMMLPFFGSEAAMAKEIYFGSEIEPVNVAPGVTTILRFPEEVKTITQAADFNIVPADAANPDYTTLAVTPRRSDGSAAVSFILANGAVISTRLTVAAKGKTGDAESIYDFKAKQDLLERRQDSLGGNVSETELMTAMIRRDQVTGYKVQRLSRDVPTGVENMEARLVAVYTGPRFNGYVFRLKNTAKKKSYAVDVRKLTLGKPSAALLSQIDRKVLTGGDGEASEATLRIVAKPSSVYYAVDLPIAPVTDPAKALPKTK